MAEVEITVHGDGSPVELGAILDDDGQAMAEPMPTLPTDVALPLAMAHEGDPPLEPGNDEPEEPA